MGGCIITIAVHGLPIFFRRAKVSVLDSLSRTNGELRPFICPLSIVATITRTRIFYLFAHIILCSMSSCVCLLRSTLFVPATANNVSSFLLSCMLDCDEYSPRFEYN